MKRLIFYKDRLNDNGIEETYGNNVLYFYELSENRQIIILDDNKDGNPDVEVYTLSGGTSGGVFSGTIIKETKHVNNEEVLNPENWVPFSSGSQTLAIVNKDVKIEYELPIKSVAGTKEIYRFIDEEESNVYKTFDLKIIFECYIDDALKIIKKIDRKNKTSKQLWEYLANTSDGSKVLSDIEKVLKDSISNKNNEPQNYTQIKESLNNAIENCKYKFKELGFCVKTQNFSFVNVTEEKLTAEQKAKNQLSILKATTDPNKASEDIKTEEESNKLKNKSILRKQEEELENIIKEMDAESQKRIISILPPALLLRQAIANDPKLFIELASTCSKRGILSSNQSTSDILQALDSLGTIPRQITQNQGTDSDDY